MSNSAIHAFGTALKIGDGGGPESFTAIAEVLDITGPGVSMSNPESTSHDNSNAFRTFMGGLLDGGEMTCDINFLPANATHDENTGLIKDQNDRTLRNFELQMVDGGSHKWSFAAYVSGLDFTSPLDDPYRASLRLKISGKPTLS